MCAAACRLVVGLRAKSGQSRTEGRSEQQAACNPGCAEKPRAWRYMLTTAGAACMQSRFVASASRQSADGDVAAKQQTGNRHLASHGICPSRRFRCAGAYRTEQPSSRTLWPFPCPPPLSRPPSCRARPSSLLPQAARLGAAARPPRKRADDAPSGHLTHTQQLPHVFLRLNHVRELSIPAPPLPPASQPLPREAPAPGRRQAAGAPRLARAAGQAPRGRGREGAGFPAKKGAPKPPTTTGPLTISSY